MREKAADCGMSIGQFMLSAALGKRTRTKIDQHVINELRRLGGLQKHLYLQSGGANARELAAVFVELQRAITRIEQG